LQSSGQVTINSGARLAVFAQHHMDLLRGDRTPLQFFRELHPRAHEQAIRQHLGHFGVTEQLASQLIEELSGGQKRRVYALPPSHIAQPLFTRSVSCSAAWRSQW
jgi:ATP-binding cassette subfamily F protein 3